MERVCGKCKSVGTPLGFWGYVVDREANRRYEEYYMKVLSTLPPDADGASPTIYEAEGDDVIVRGYKVSEELLKELNINPPPGETVVFVPKELLMNLAPDKLKE